MLDIARLQSRLNSRGLSPGAPLAIDGRAGPATWAAVFRFAGAGANVARELGTGAARFFDQYGISATGLRVAHFIGQAAHETLGFRYLEELGGAAYFSRMYDNRRDLGNDGPGSGDGARWHGRGIFQLTGEDNYSRMQTRLGVPLVQHPELASDPVISVQIACDYWVSRGISVLADADNLEAVTRKINGGFNGLADRRVRTDALKALVL